MEFIKMQFDAELLKKFSKYTLIAGILMMIIGFVGVFAPQAFSLAVVSFMSWLFLFSAFVQGFNTYKNYRKSFSAWLKPIMSFITAVLFVFFPIEGVAATGMLLAVYLMIDGYSSIAFGFEYKPHKGWWMMILNGIFSIILAVILISGWPFSSFVLVGLFVGISLIFDGVALITFALGARKLNQ